MFDMLLDVNIELYPIEEGEKITVALAYTLNRDGRPDEGHYGKETQAGENTLLEDFDYVMYGKIFRFRDTETKGGQPAAEVLVSFGGLLMQLSGPPKQLQGLELDRRVYLLVRKV